MCINSGNTLSPIVPYSSNHSKDTIYTLNNEQQWLYCNLCDNGFITMDDLEAHQNVHVENNSYSCTACNFASNTECDLMEHRCDVNDFESSFVTASESSDEQTIVSDFSFSDIPQIDGIIEYSHSVSDSRLSDTHDNIRIAPYRLDRNKQVEKLAEDASKEDFEIDVSKNGHNVTILCSTGFYSLVAQPAFVHIFPGFSAYLDTLVLTCFDRTNKVDSLNANVNNVFFFRVESHSKNVVGKVTVHLHHTARKVQIQGGALISDRKRACVWFLEQYILGHFRISAKEKTIDISNFNSAVLKLVSEHATNIEKLVKCAACNVAFHVRSSRQDCTICRGTFHKACLTRDTHLCFGAGPSGQKAPEAQRSDLTTVTKPYTTITNPNQVPNTPAINFDNQEHPSLSLNCSKSDDPCDTQPIYNSETSSRTNLPLVDSAPSNSESQSLRENRKEKITGKKSKSAIKNTLGTTEVEIASEFTRAQMKTLQIKLKEQESSLKDLKFQNSVLLERIAVLEKPQKQTIYSTYFPNHANAGTDNYNCCHHANGCFNMQSHSSCCRPQNPSCCPPQNSCATIQQQLCNISQKLDTVLSAKIPPSSCTNHSTDRQEKSSATQSKFNIASDNVLETPTSHSEEHPGHSISNESVISIDHLMPDPEQDVSLNSKVLTSRLEQPMLSN